MNEWILTSSVHKKWSEIKFSGQETEPCIVQGRPVDAIKSSSHKRCSQHHAKSATQKCSPFYLEQEEYSGTITIFREHILSFCPQTLGREQYTWCHDQMPFAQGSGKTNTSFQGDAATSQEKRKVSRLLTSAHDKVLKSSSSSRSTLQGHRLDEISFSHQSGSSN